MWKLTLRAAALTGVYAVALAGCTSTGAAVKAPDSAGSDGAIVALAGQ